MIRLGFHLSIAGSVANAPREAALEGYGAFQVFTTSSRSWKNSAMDADGCSEFKELTRSNGLEAFAHIPYLCNPASPNAEVYRKSKEMLVSNMGNCDALGIKYLVIHLGSHLGKGIGIGMENICGAVSNAIDSAGNVDILLENGSGYTNCVGSRFEDIGKIMDVLDSDRIGLCFDTCHAFAAGYDISDSDGVDKTVEELERCIGLSRLKLVHLNDAKYPIGSGLDRHEHIGRGNIGREGFVALFCNGAFRNGSFVMELPADSNGGHADDMHAVGSIMADAGI
ncbi:MAG: deoxyribonuclease IV [Candidatus Micrarchaeota archaeon]|nr:deoxyribonuclease IV [Candidatus Micrarchaeota archaeon]